MDNKKALEMLFKIANNQQKVIKKMAQALTQAVDPNVDYLKSKLAQIAGLNTGLNNVTVTNVDARGDGTYMIHISGVPVEKRQAFSATLKRQLASQKPELEDKVSYIFEG